MFNLNADLDGNKRHYIEHNLALGSYLMNYKLEDVFAHESQVSLR